MIGASVGISTEELQLALRNSGMPLEALRWPLTPLGLHYLLSHYDIPTVEVDSWQLELVGRVACPTALSLRELKQRETVTVPVTMECAGNGRAGMTPRPMSQPWLTEAIGTAAWTGTPLASLLREAGLSEEAVEILFSGLDCGVEGGITQTYERSLPISDALEAGAILAWAIGGVALPPQHGFPLRLVVPGWYGMTNVKWLRRITVLDAAFDGYQQAQGYRIRQNADEPGEPVTRIAPRALMVPPGIPDFMTRRRFVAPGTHTLEGRAWSGWGEVTRVAVSVTGGERWDDAELSGAVGRHAWRGWSYSWASAEPGDYQLACRAWDSVGNSQPLEPEWNLGGYANNAVQRIAVTVKPD
ncbi:MAG TPA: sulfite oxidase [Solirubrobacteraceae bacterium]|nr:sulfite oxidase [Solirubrobacteraceae bacterium]